MFSLYSRNLFFVLAILFFGCDEKKSSPPLTTDTTFTKHVPGIIEQYHITAKLIDKPDFTPMCGVFIVFADYHFIMANNGDTVLVEMGCPEFYKGKLFPDSTYDITGSLVRPSEFPLPVNGEAPEDP